MNGGPTTMIFGKDEPPRRRSTDHPRRRASDTAGELVLRRAETQLTKLEGMLNEYEQLVGQLRARIAKRGR